MSTPPPPSVAKTRQSGGFALLITITLLAFLVLLLVSLATLTRVETQVAGNNQTLTQARQNALMALNVALGQLQKYTGPDQRVTATADVTIPSAVAIGAATTASAAHAALDTYWNATRNPRWTGVWTNGNTDAYQADNPSAGNASPLVQTWLVSGNETALTFQPTNTVTGLGASSTPVDDIKDSSGRVHRLLVKSSAGVTDSNSLLRAVTAPQVPIQGTAPGIADAQTTGHYAWWIGDEGVKARANLTDPYATDTTDDGKFRRQSSAQRPAVEAMTVNGASAPTGNADSDGLAPYYPANTSAVTGVLNLPQLDFLDARSPYPAQLRQRYHDLTVSSRGVLADVKNGGLKRDLSYLLGQSSLSALRSAINAVYGGTAAAPSASYNPALSPTTTRYATPPPDVPGAQSYSTAPGILGYSATWEQLWSFYNLGNLTTATPAGVFDSSGTAHARLHGSGGVQHGLYPLLIQGKLFYRLRMEGGTIWVDVIPVAVLANPYNVTLSGEYTLYLGGFGLQLLFGNPVDPANPVVPNNNATPAEFAAPSGYTDLSNAYVGSVQLVIHSGGIPPGEAQIFTLDTTVTIPATTSAQAAVKAIMINEFDPTTALTYNTGQSIPPDKTHAALYCQTAKMVGSLSIDYNTTDRDKRLVHYVKAKDASTDLRAFIVNPMNAGTLQGGGIYFTVNDGIPNSSANSTTIPQQALFYQLNYRSLLAFWLGYSSGEHLMEWAKTTTKSGASAGSGAYNPWIEANLMRPSGSTTSTRWGLVNNGTGPTGTVAPDSIGGSSSSVGRSNLLYDLPRPGQPLSSLGQLQHFNTAGHVPVTSFTAAQYHTVVHSWQVNYPVSNSYPHPRVDRNQVFASSGTTGAHYDGSYLWNDLFSDRFYFSTYPASGPFDFAMDKLANARHRPFRAPGEVSWSDPTQFRGTAGSPSVGANSRLAAQNLLVDGAFNINSTSYEAWKAVFASLRGVPCGSETSSALLTAPFARTSHQTGGAGDSKAGNTDNAWNRIRNLTQAEVNSLAEEMVLQVRKRGPFLSMADFINRRLVSSSADTYGLGLSGALQAALDKVVNQKADVAAPFNASSDTVLASAQIKDTGYVMPTAISGFPGYLLQGDVLSSLGSSLTARSDTFTIRTYGDVVNPATTLVEGRAWCEAVVQRLPDYVVAKNGASGNAPNEDATDATNVLFGRRYTVVSFRWLSPNDL